MASENEEMRAALRKARETGKQIEFTRGKIHFRADPDGRAWEWTGDWYQRWTPRGGEG